MTAYTNKSNLKLLKASLTKAANLVYRLRRMLRIAVSAYSSLTFQDHLNSRFNMHKRPFVEVVVTSDDLEQVRVSDTQFYWPAELGHKGLGTLYKEIFLPPEDNPHAYEVGPVRIQPDDWVIDAGACEGYFTWFALQRKANVLAIEPVPRLAQALRRTYAQEINAGQVKILEAALSDAPGELALDIPVGRLDQAQLSEKGQIKVPVYTLDKILADQIIPRVDFIKMDIEGAEVATILGASEVLKAEQPKLSLAVYHEEPNARIIKNHILKTQSQYQVCFRGVFLRQGYGAPRPYMLHGHV